MRSLPARGPGPELPITADIDFDPRVRNSRVPKSMDPKVLSMWFSEKLRRGATDFVVPGVEDGQPVEINIPPPLPWDFDRIRIRRSANGGFHIEVTYRPHGKPCNPAQALIVRRMLGDDPARLYYDASRARDEPDSAFGILFDSKSNGGGSDWSHSDPWVELPKYDDGTS